MAEEHHKHSAIYALYSDVVSVRGEEGVLYAYDEDGELYEYDSDAVDARAEEKKAAYELDELRKERNKLLQETDYWSAPDLPDMTEEQTTYRQALRDITDTYTSLDDVVWPTKPE